MIARYWKGRVPAEKEEAYLAYVKETGINAQSHLLTARGHDI